MKVFQSKSFVDFQDRDSGSTFCDLVLFRDCYFESCAVSATRNPNLRSRVHNVQLINCNQRGCSLGTAIIEDSLIDGLVSNGQLFQTFGAVFNRVVLKGKIDRLMISNNVLPDLLLNPDYWHEDIDAFRCANAEHYSKVEWALDISGAEFKECDIRGVPSHLIRRDPETQIVVTREKAALRDWESLPLKDALWRSWLQHFLLREESSVVLVAPKLHKKFRLYLDDLRLLQEAGVAEPD